MTICTGNDYIFSVIIDHDRLCFMAIHEKDETCTDDDIPETYGAACIVNKELSIIDFGFPHDIIHSEAFKEVDDVSIFYIENIVNAYYRVLRTHESKRGEKGMYIIAVFEQFIKVILQYLMADLEKDESACKKWGSIIHWVLVIPDEWNIKYIDTIKKHMINTGLRSIDTLTIIHQSYALIRHLELPHYHHSFINGEFYIVCIFKEHNKIALYGYEIGPPLKGLKNTTKHTLTEIHHLSIQYETKYFIDTIFDGNRKELEQYNINLNTLANLGHFEYWDNAEGTLYEVVSHLKNGYLSDVKESFLVEKEKELKSITLETIRDSRLLSSAGYAAIKDKIIEISKAHLSVKVIVLNDLEYVDDAITESLIDQLPPTLLAKHHNYIISEGSIFTTGAAQIIQCQLIIDNYIPQVENKEALDSISEGDIMYIDINWKCNSVVYINAENKEMCIENTSTAVNNCYSLNDCFKIIKNKHQFHRSDIHITNKYTKMLLPDNQYSPQNTPPSKDNNVLEVDEAVKLLEVIEPNIQQSKKIDIQLYEKTSIPRDLLKELLIVYIECLQEHIIQYMLSMNDQSNPFTHYFSIDQSILDTFLTDHEEICEIFEEYNTKHLPRHRMKLIHREQVSAVHYKDTIECHSRVEEYLDYPQYMMQVQLNPTYIDLALNVIMPLDKDITLANNEIVLTLKRKRIQYDMVNVLSNLLWEHILSREECPIDTCSGHEHTDYEDNADMYLQFINHFDSWFIQEYTMVNSQNDIDWNKQIQMNMNSQCACVFMITPMDIFDICIIPAIQQIMFMVYGATTNIYIFGEYKINHIVLMGLIMDITCAATYTQVQYLLKKCVENQNKYYNHITLHWIDDEIQKVLNKGIESIKANPAGGLLEQILTGTYYGMFDDQVYTDFNRLQLSTEKEFFHLIRKNTRVTEDMRENGITTLFYYNDSENTLKLYYGPNRIDDMEKRIINDYNIEEIDSFPIKVKFIVGIKEVVFSIGTGPEGNTNVEGVNTDKFYFREDLVLSPFI